MSLRSPLGKVLGSGSAKDGTEDWWAQRLTAVGLLFLGAWFLYGITQMGGFTYVEVIDWVGRPINSILMILLTLTLAYHSKLGMQVIIEDYVHGSLTKVFALVLNQFGHILIAIVTLFAVLKIAFGAEI